MTGCETAYGLQIRLDSRSAYVPALLGGFNTSRPTITDIVLSEHIVHLRTVPSTLANTGPV